MAVTFDAVGPSSAGQVQATTAAFTWTHTPAGTPTEVVVFLVAGLAGTTTAGQIGSYASVSYGGNAMTLDSSVAGNNSTFGGIFCYKLANPPAGAQTVSVGAYTPPSGGTFSQTLGFSITAAGGGGGFATHPSPVFGNAASGSLSFLGTTSGGLCIAGACDGTGAPGEAVTSGTQRFLKDQNSSSMGNAIGGTLASTGGTTTITMTWTADFYGIVGVEVLPAGGPPAGVAAQPEQRSRARIADRRGRYRRQQIQTAFGTPPPAAGVVSLQGTGTLDTSGGGVTQQAGATLSGTGSITGIVNPYITGLSGSTSADYFVDQTGKPRWMFCDSIWTLIYTAGRSGSQTWQQDIDQVVSTRASQGYTAIQTNMLPNNEYATLNGKTWDGISPFNTGVDPASGLNSTYWARADYLVAALAKKGMTWFANLFFGEDLQAGGVAGAWTSSQKTAYGNAVATRYLSTPNIIWMINDDGVADSTTCSNILTGVRNAGDSRFISTENPQETTSRFGLKLNDVQTFGTASAQYNWVYTYAPSYSGIEYAFNEASPIPVIRGDGYYFGTIGGTDDRVSREQFWWCISSASRGYSWGMFDGGWGAFATGWPSNLTAAGEESGTAGDFNNTVFPAVTAFLTALPNWQKLRPDIANAFITAGRGTRAPYQTEGIQNQYDGTTPDTYVSGSYANDGSIAMIYFSRGVTTTITIDQTKLASGYTGKWVDPANCSTTTATTGSTYTKPSSANSAGDHDWLLLLQAPTAQAGVATLSGTGSLATAATLGAGTTLGAAGSVTSAAVQGAGATLGGAASLGNLDTTGAPATLGGTGSLTTAAVQGVKATLSATGSISALATQLAPATLAGTGALTALSAQVPAAVTLAGTASLGNLDITGAPATLGAAGSLSTAAVQGVTATLAGTGSLSTAITQGAIAILAGTGSIAALATQGAGATLTGTGSITGNANQGAQLGGAGSIGALATQLAPATLSGTGSIAALATQLAPATLAGTGSITALATQLAPATLAGTGSIATAVTLGATAVLGGTGLISTAAVQGAGATLSGAGSISGNVGQGAQLGGQGSIGALATIAAPATLAGAGALSTAATEIPAALTLTGAGSLGNLDITGAPATLGGAGALTTAAVQGAGASLSAAGSLSTAAILRAPATLPAAGSLTAAGGPAGAATLAGTGSITGTGVSAGGAGATLAGTGSIGTLAILRPVGTLAAAGQLITGAVQLAGTVIAAAGSLTAFGTQHPPQIKGFSINTAVTRPQASLAAVGEAASMSASVTQPMTSTSGVS